MNDASVTFGWFVRNRFFPLKEAHWKEETAKVKKLLIQQDLIEEFEDVPLENFDKFTLQVHLNKLARTRSKDRVLQMRAYLRDIFAEAADQDFLAKDPARKVKVPSQLRDTDKTILTWDQLRMALSELSVRDRLLLELDMTNALRPSELFGLRWKSFNQAASTMCVTETVYKGNIRPWGKTRRSLAAVPPAERPGREARRVEAAVTGFVSGCFHLSESRWRLSGYGQLSQAGAAQAGPKPGTAETDVSGHPQNDCHAGPEEGNSQRRARRAPALPRSHHNRCLHAGDSGERPGDGQFDSPRVESEGRALQFAPERGLCHDPKRTQRSSRKAESLRVKSGPKGQFRASPKNGSKTEQSAPVSERGFLNLLPNATKSERGDSVSY